MKSYIQESLIAITLILLCANVCAGPSVGDYSLDSAIAYNKSKKRQMEVGIATFKKNENKATDPLVKETYRIRREVTETSLEMTNATIEFFQQSKENLIAVE
ncbi:MAG: hypothetical protein NTX86_01670 [Candidatus Dependentiae bacterium]|nr:hypothetical protein [Candidatus Dependentiae bacterium]